MVALMIAIALKQGAKVWHSFTCFDDDEPPIADDIENSCAALRVARAELVMAAPTLPMAAFRKIHRQQMSLIHTSQRTRPYYHLYD